MFAQLQKNKMMRAGRIEKIVSLWQSLLRKVMIFENENTKQGMINADITISKETP
jgi:hypothetical protein